VPSAEREFPPAITPNPVYFTGQVRTMASAGPNPGGDPVVARARAVAVAWLDRRAVERHSSPGHRMVLGHGDPCPANFLSLFDLTHAEAARVHDYRRLAALFWLIMLRPGGTSSTRNPPGTLERQADRLLELLG
jgi:hypothetical protein